MGNFCSGESTQSAQSTEKKKSSKSKSSSKAKSSNALNAVPQTNKPRRRLKQAKMDGAAGSPSEVPASHQESEFLPMQPEASQQPSTLQDEMTKGRPEASDRSDANPLTVPRETDQPRPTPEPAGRSLMTGEELVNETDSLHMGASAVLDDSDDWSRRVSVEGEDYDRKVSLFTEAEQRHQSLGSSTDRSSTTSETGASQKGVRVVASRVAARSGPVLGDNSCASSLVDDSTATPTSSRRTEEKLVRRRAKALVLWIKTLPLPPYEDIPDDGVRAANAEVEPFDEDAERRFSKID